MSQSKDLFQRNKQDVKDAIEITSKDIFYKMIAYSRAEFNENNPTSQEAAGANNFINILMNLPEKGTEPPEWIDSGLKHDLSVPARDVIQTQQTK